MDPGRRSMHAMPSGSELACGTASRPSSTRTHLRRSPQHHPKDITVAVVLVLHSSKAVDKATTKHAVRRWWAAPDPGFGPGIEVFGRHPCCQIELLGVGEGLAGERLAAEEAPPAFLQVQPAGPRRDRDGMRARVLRQPLLDGPTGMAGEIVAHEIQLALRMGRIQQLEELEVADGVARGRSEGEFVAVTHPQGPIDPDLLVPTPVVHGRLDPVTGGGPAGGWGEATRDHRPKFVEAEGRRTFGRVGVAGDDRRPFGAKSFALLCPQVWVRRQRTPSRRTMRRTWLRPIWMPCAWSAAANASSDHSETSPPSLAAGASVPSE